jgi:hypothetical protein
LIEQYRKLMEDASGLSKNRLNKPFAISHLQGCVTIKDNQSTSIPQGISKDFKAVQRKGAVGVITRATTDF